MARPHKIVSLGFRKKRGKPYNSDPKADERAKKQWLKEHEITKLPPGCSRWGYEPG